MRQKLIFQRKHEGCEGLGSRTDGGETLGVPIEKGVEVGRDQGYAAAIQGGGIDDFFSGVHGREGQRSNAAAATRSVVTRVMQRWSMGQSRKKARAALGVLADDARAAAGGSGSRVVGRAEYRRYGDAQRAGDVHRAGIVGKEEAACRG